MRNAATFKDIRAGENGLELFKVEKLFIFSNSFKIVIGSYIIVIVIL